VGWWPEGAAIRPSFHCFLFPPPQQRLVVHTQITHCKYTLPRTPFCQYKSLILRKTNHKEHQRHTIAITFHHQLHSEESLPPRSSNFTTSGPVVTTSARIAAVSARALPARAAHLSGWILRLCPTALRACACTQHTQHTYTRTQHILALH
jgi:hypothetical protein